MGSSKFRFSVSRRDLVFGALGAAPIVLSPIAAEAKLSQTSVGYQDPAADDKQCGGCNFFVSPNACKLVDGAVSPTGHCRYWAKKAG